MVWLSQKSECCGTLAHNYTGSDVSRWLDDEGNNACASFVKYILSSEYRITMGLHYFPHFIDEKTGKSSPYLHMSILHV